VSSRFCIQNFPKKLYSGQKCFVSIPWVKPYNRETVGADNLLLFVLCGGFGMPLSQKIAEYNRFGEKVSKVSGLQTF